VLSFFPEYWLIKSLFNLAPELHKKIVGEKLQTKSILEKLTEGWREFFKQPIMPAMLAYAILWLSVLSPHGVLLTAFLKKGWNLSEFVIGIFRGAGAVFGLLATLLYPRLERKYGVIAASRAFIFFQATMVVLALICFSNQVYYQLLFLMFILLSRIGLYGFSIGETQIRQTNIAEHERGRINGFASALTAIATIGLYGAGAIFAEPAKFYLLVCGSVVAVLSAAILFECWLRLKARNMAYDATN
jgi:iron-regulated transporter 1